MKKNNIKRYYKHGQREIVERKTLNFRLCRSRLLKKRANGINTVFSEFTKILLKRCY